jgi:hypothetical protein
MVMHEHWPAAQAPPTMDKNKSRRDPHHLSGAENFDANRNELDAASRHVES